MNRDTPLNGEGLVKALERGLDLPRVLERAGEDVEEPGLSLEDRLTNQEGLDGLELAIHQERVGELSPRGREMGRFFCERREGTVALRLWESERICVAEVEVIWVSSEGALQEL